MRKYTLVAVIALASAACSSNYRASETGRNRAATAERRDVANDRRDFEDRVQARLDKLEREIKEWKDRKAGAKTEHAKRTSDRRIDDLEKLKDETRAKLNDLKGGANENWQKFKAEASEAMDKLEVKWNEFKNNVKRKV